MIDEPSNIPYRYLALSLQWVVFTPLIQKLSDPVILAPKSMTNIIHLLRKQKLAHLLNHRNL